MIRLFSFFLLWAASLYSAIDTEKESMHLQNIRQLTAPSMGFEKAGEAYFSPDGSSIIFQAVPTGEKQYQIYIMNLEEMVPRMVSTGRGACTCAYFHPSGKKIIFASSHEAPEEMAHNVPGYQRNSSRYSWEFTPYMNIYEANPDGSELKALTSGPAYTAECAYSADGKKIVFASNRDGSMNLYVMNSDGTDIKQVTQTTSCYNGGPFFSPDGETVVFRADPDKADYLQIYTIGVDGTNLVQLTDNEAVNWAPYWHPGGRFVAYTTSLHGHWQYEVYLMDILTKEQTRLTYNETFDGLPVFSNDGTKMMWTSKRGSDHTSQIFIADFSLQSFYLNTKTLLL